MVLAIALLGIGMNVVLNSLYKTVGLSKKLLLKYEQYIKEQIQSLPWDQMKVLVIENLNGIKIGGSGKKNLGRSFNKRNASWLVRQVQIGLAHYAQQNGVLLVQIDPKYTSLQCPSCGAVTVSKKGKVCHRDGETYYRVCEESGRVSLDADYVGAYNIRQRLFYWVKQGCMPYSKKAKTVNEAFEPIHNTQGAGVPSSD